VGMVGSSYFTGNLLGTLLTGRLIRRLGFNHSYYLASLIFAAGCVGLGLMIGFWSWMIWRFIAGVGCAMIWVVVESALMCSGTSRNRGRLLAAYMMVYYVGTVLGQIMVSKLPTDLMSVLPWTTALVLAAILPLLFTRIVNQHSEEQTPTSLWPMFRLRHARLGVNGCIISGIILGSLYGLMPLYLSHQGISDSGIGFWMALMVSAGIVGQWPIGRLADRFGRLLVLRVQVFVVIVGCFAMLSNAAMAPALFVLGTAGFTLYPVAIQVRHKTKPQRCVVALLFLRPSVHHFVTILFKDAFDALHGLFLRWVNTVQLILFTHRDPFMFAKFMVGQQFDLLDVTHIAGKLAKAMSRVIIVGPAWNHNVADPHLDIFLREILGKFQRAMV